MTHSLSLRGSVELRKGMHSNISILTKESKVFVL